MLPKDIVFDIWTEETLRIIPCILFPMEKKLIEIINAETKKCVSGSVNEKLKLRELDKNSILYKLYKDSLSRTRHKCRVIFS